MNNKLQKAMYEKLWDTWMKAREESALRREDSYQNYLRKRGIIR